MAHFLKKLIVRPHAGGLWSEVGPAKEGRCRGEKPEGPGGDDDDVGGEVRVEGIFSRTRDDQPALDGQPHQGE